MPYKARTRRPGRRPCGRTPPYGVRVDGADGSTERDKTMGRVIVCGVAWACLCGALAASEAKISSPDGRGELTVREGRSLTWSVSRDGHDLLDRASRLGLKFKNRPEAVDWHLAVESVRTVRDDFLTPHYRKDSIHTHCREATIRATAANGETLGLLLRAYPNAVAWRYILPGQEPYEIERELTTWTFPGEPAAWLSFFDAWGDYLYGGLGADEGGIFRYTLAGLSGNGVAGVPLLVEGNGCLMALCEADLTDWAALSFVADTLHGRIRQGTTLRAELVRARASDIAVRGHARRQSPWRVLLLAPDEVALLDGTDILLALNPPPAGDFSWVKPGVSSWDWWADSPAFAIEQTTEQTLEMVDFAAEMEWPYHTIDAGWYGKNAQGPDALLDPRPGYDLPRILEHSRQKGVGIWLWLHWTALDNGRNPLEETFAKFERWGVKGLKIDFMERADQSMVQWYARVVESAARHHLMINYHGAYHPTGMNRTWPNQITREAIRGNEMNKFFGTITPAHMATLPYTRFLLGPADYTPGAFHAVYSKDFVPQVRREAAKSSTRVYPEEVGTRAHALALCIAYDSPLVTLCDWPCNYRSQPGIEALRALPTVWKNSWPLSGGKIASHYGVLRQAYDGRYYFAALTVKARTVEVPLDRLPQGQFIAEIYCDDPARTPHDPNAIRFERRTVTRIDTLLLDLLAEGGAVVLLRPKP